MARRLPLPALALAAAALVLGARPGSAATPNPPNDTLFGDQSALKAIKAPEAWAKGTGAGVKVAVVSTGIAKDHPDLSANTAAGFDATGDDATVDVDGRGTHLAGIVGATTHNGRGIAAVAPDAQVLAFKAFESADALDADAYLEALEKAGAAAPVVLVDLSAGFPDAREGRLREVLAAMAGRGVSVVAGVQGGVPLAGLPILVASPTAAGDQFLVAPANVLSTTVTRATLPGSFDYDYGEKSGSNRSAALVAGAVALLRGAGADAPQAAQALRSTKSAGGGTIDVAAAMNAFTTPPPPPPPPPETTTTTKKPAATATTKPGTPTTTAPGGLSDTAGFTGPPLPAEPVELGEEDAVLPPGAEELYELEGSGDAGSPAEEDDRPLGLLAVGFGMLCGVGSGLSLTFRRLAGPPL